MSVSARNWAWDLTEHLPAMEGYVLVYLAEMENVSKGYAFPSQETIARKTHQSSRNVRNILQMLVDRQLIRIEKNQTLGGWMQSEYYLQVPDEYRDEDKTWRKANP